MAGHRTSMFVAVVVGQLNLRHCRISVFGRWLASLGTGFVADRLSIGRVRFVVVSQPKLGHISAITWLCLELLSAAARPSHGCLFGASCSCPSVALLAVSRLFLGSVLADSRFLSRLSAGVDGSRSHLSGWTLAVSRPSHGSYSAASIQLLSGSLSGRVSATSRSFLGQLALNRSYLAASRPSFDCFWLSLGYWPPPSATRSAIYRLALYSHLVVSRPYLGHHLAVSRPSLSRCSAISRSSLWRVS